MAIAICRFQISTARKQVNHSKNSFICLMRTLRSKYLSDIPIKEDNFKADFNVLEKYQEFSSEILRLSLLGLAIYGFLLTDVIFKITKNDTFIFLKPFFDNKAIFITGAVALIMAALCALGHRYFSTDCMTHFIRGLRLKMRFSELKEESNGEEDSSEKAELEKKIENENASFESDLSKCKWLLIGAGGSFILGIFFVIFGLGKTLHDAALILK